MTFSSSGKKDFEAWSAYYTRQNQDFDILKSQSYKLKHEQVEARSTLRFRDIKMKVWWESEFNFANDLEFKKPENSCKVLNSIVIDLLKAAQGGQAIWYSRNGNSYSSCSTGIVGLDTVKNAIDFLVKNGLAVNFIVPKGTNNKQSSFVYATPALVKRYGYVLRRQRYKKSEESPIVTLRLSKTKKMISVPKTEFFNDAKAETIAHNGYIRTIEIKLSGKILKENGSLITYKDYQGNEQTIDTQRCDLVRKFIKAPLSSEYEAHGGRYYGGFWQGMNEADRKRILLNGEPVGRELDYSCVGLQMAYAKSGQRLNGDGYLIDINGLNLSGNPVMLSKPNARKIIKKSVSIVFNTTSLNCAKRAIVKTLKELYPKIFKGHSYSETSKYASEVLSRIFEEHSAVSNLFCSDFGVQSQFMDSQVMTAIHQKCRDLGIPILSIHDSILYPENRTELVTQIFDEALENFLSSTIAKPSLGIAA